MVAGPDGSLDWERLTGDDGRERVWCQFIGCALEDVEAAVSRLGEGVRAQVGRFVMIFREPDPDYWMACLDVAAVLSSGERCAARRAERVEAWATYCVKVAAREAWKAAKKAE